MSEHPRSGGDADPVLETWNEALGAGADPELSFLENGGDSFLAVKLSTALFQATGVEIDFIDILETDGVDGLRRLLDTKAEAS
ncbi:acyl carrier protein [Streptomyces sclerotialus]|uniref:acyl carrier protein n=1 Tax=Streptomyces sclerotialus TaxID=1957 RepID=UPI0018CB1926